MNEKVQKIKCEFIRVGNLTQYENTIERILQSIFDTDCEISCCYICENSSIEQTIDNSRKPHIRIGFKRPKEKPIHIIWDILHEFGHFLSGLPIGKGGTPEREIQAWDIGFEQLKKYPELVDQIDDYKKYREKCLKNNK